MREALAVAEERLNASQGEVEQLRADLAKAQQQLPGWDLDLDDDAAPVPENVAPSARAVEEAREEARVAVEEANREATQLRGALAVAEERLNASQGEVEQLRAVLAKTQQQLPAPGTTLSHHTGVPAEDGGWDLDLDDEPAPVPENVAPSARALEEAREEARVAVEEANREAAQMREALAVAEERLNASQGEVEQLRVDLAKAQEQLPAPDTTPPHQTGVPAEDGGWDLDFDDEAAPVPDTVAPSERTVEEAREEARVAVEEANREAAQMREALSVAEERLNGSQGEVEQLRADLAKAQQQLPAPGTTLPPQAGVPAEDGGWDLDLDDEAALVPDTVAPFARAVEEEREEARMAVEEARAEAVQLREALGLAEERLSCSHKEVDQLRADLDEAQQQQPAAATTFPNIELEDEAPPASPPFSDVRASVACANEEVREEAREAVEQARQETAGLRKALGLAEARLSDSRVEVDQLRADVGKAQLQPCAEATTLRNQDASQGAEDGGWDLDFDEEPTAISPAIDAASSSAHAIEVAREEARHAAEAAERARGEAAQLRDTLELAEERLSSSQEEVEQLRADLDKAKQQPAKGTTLPDQIALQHGSLADDAGWDIDFDEEASAAPPPGPNVASHSARAIEEAREEARRAAEEARGEVTQLREALDLAEERLGSSQEQVNQLRADLEKSQQRHHEPSTTSSMQAALQDGTAAGDGGWDFDFDDEAPPARSPAPDRIALSVQAHEEALEVSRREIEEARADIAQLREKLGLSEEVVKQSRGEAAQLREALLLSDESLRTAQEEAELIKADLEMARRNTPNPDTILPTQSAAQRVALAGDAGWDLDFDDEAPALASPAPDTAALEAQALQEARDEAHEAAEEARSEATSLREALGSAEKRLSSSLVQVEELRTELEKLHQRAPSPGANLLNQAASQGEDAGWDFDFDNEAPPPPSLVEDSAALPKRASEEARNKAHQELLEAHSEAAQLREALTHAEERLESSHACIDELRAELSKAKTPVNVQPKIVSGDAEWDFNFNMGEETLAAAPTGAEVDDKDGWGFDMLESSAQPPGDEAQSTAQAVGQAHKDEAHLHETLRLLQEQLAKSREEVMHLQAEQTQALSAGCSSARALAEVKEEARQAISALAEAREQLGEQERRSTEAAEEVSRLTEEGSWSLDALAEARRRLADEEQRFSEADTERVRLRVALKQAEAKARARAGNGDPGAGNGSLGEEPLAGAGPFAASTLMAGLSHLRAAAGSAAASATKATSSPPAAGSKDDNNGWDLDFDGEESGEITGGPRPAAQGGRVSSADPDVEPVSKKEAERLSTELAVAAGRLAIAQRELEAERAAHSSSVAAALRAELAILAEELTKERQDRERLSRHVQEDLEQQTTALHAATASSGPEAQVDQALVIQQLEQLRQQRDQARSIAQCIARQTSTLADESHRLRTAGASAGPSPPRSHDPERTLQRAGTHGDDDAGPAGAMAVEEGPEEQRRDPAVASEEAMILENLLGDGGSGGGMAHGHLSEAMSSHTEGEEALAPRPPDEVTSGWDVFDPDDQNEHTIPTALGAHSTAAGGGWDTDDFSRLFDGFDAGSTTAVGATPAGGGSDSAPGGSAAGAPELSAAAPALTRGGVSSGGALQGAAVTGARPMDNHDELDFEGLLTAQDLI